MGLSESLMSALPVGNGFCLCRSDVKLSRLRVLWASMMLSENIVDAIDSIFSSLKIGLEAACRLENEKRRIADF